MLSLNDTLAPIRDHLHAGGILTLTGTENGDLTAYAYESPNGWRYVIETSRDGTPSYADPPAFNVETLVGAMGRYGALGAWNAEDPT